MNLCTIDKINPAPDAGDFLLIVDQGYEGIRIEGQFPSVEAAIATAMLGNSYGRPTAIVKLVRVSITEH